MKKRTIFIAIVSLLAAITGYIPAALAAPPGPRLPAPPPVPAITEQGTVVVAPGQVSQLPIWLDSGESVIGYVAVVSGEVSFTIRDPNDKIVVNAGTVSDNTTFSFRAALRGTYQFVFGNTLYLLANKVVIVRVQHSGPQVFPTFSGTSVGVGPGETERLVMELSARQAVEGFLTIRGGQEDITFSVTDAAGNTVTSPGRVYTSCTFAFTPAASGLYYLKFDNSFSTYLSKLVSIEMRKGGQSPWWGTATRLAFMTSPASAMAGTPFATQPVVIVTNDDGSPAANSSTAITLSITPSTGASNALLTGTTTVNAANGMAYFGGLSIDRAGSGYKLTASASGLTPAVSEPFTITPPPPVDYVALNAGWNLISLPVIPAESAISTVLSPVSDNVISVWRYDTTSANWLSYVPGLGGTLDTVIDGSAYWVNMRAPATLTINASTSTARPAYPVATGWNMVGFKSTVPKLAADYLTGTSYRTFPAYEHNSGAFFTINPAADELKPGKGYWIYFEAAASIRP